MKRFYCLFIFGILSKIATGQQRPQYTQYLLNNYLINPAVSGIESYIDLKASWRNQWTNLTGSPETHYVSLHAPIGQVFIDHQQNSDSQSRGSSSYEAAPPHHGIGVTAVVDKAGLISRRDFNASYAYHLKISSKLNFSVGLAAGVSEVTMDLSQIKLETNFDPAISLLANDQIKPDLALGMWLYASNYYFGASAQQLLGLSLNFGTHTETYNIGKLVPHHLITAGYKFSPVQGITVGSSFLISRTAGAPIAYDGNVKFTFLEKLWLGGNYRHADSFSAFAGLNVSHLLNFGYAYDFTTSKLGGVSNGTHEIVLGLLLNNRNKNFCPQRYW